MTPKPSANKQSKPKMGLPAILFGLVLVGGASWFFLFSKPTVVDPTPIVKVGDNLSDSPDPTDTTDTDFKRLAQLETLQNRLTDRLKKLSERYSSPNALTLEQVSQFATDDFSARPLLAANLESVFQSSDDAVAGFTAQRMTTAPNESNASVDFQSFMTSILNPITGGSEASNLRSKFKIFRIDNNATKTETEVLVSFFALNTNRQSGELNATVQMVWNQSNDSGPPRIESIQILDYECAMYHGERPVGFEDHTGSLFAGDSTLAEQFGQGAEQWTAKIADHGIFGYNGICVGDVNGDGLDDAYLCQPFGLPNRLLMQQPDGSARDVSSDWNVNISEHTRSSLLIDLNNDGKQDLIVGTAGGLLVYQNTGSSFRLKSRYADILDPYSLSSADFDNDGDLDIYVCGYYDKLAEGRRFPFAFPMHDSNSGGPNTLLQNEGDFQFADVTAQVGLDQDNQKYTYAAGWQDYDNDGDQDLYVANDYGRNCFYVQENGQFKNLAADLDIEDQSFGMSVDWADINHDGWMDLYVSNMYSTAGNRVSFQDNYLSERPELQNRMQYMARGNSLFLGSQQGFRDIGDSANVFMGRWAWGSKFVDMNNDGWDDVVVPNGFLSRKIADDL